MGRFPVTKPRETVSREREFLDECFGEPCDVPSEWGVRAWLVTPRVDHSPAAEAGIYIVDVHDNGSLFALVVRVIEPDLEGEPGETLFVDLSHESDARAMAITADRIRQALTTSSVFEAFGERVLGAE